MTCICRIASLAAGLLAVGNATAAPITGSCSPTSVKFIASDPTFFQTTSTVFVDVPQSAVSFSQGGTAASCVIVSVSADPASAPHSQPNPAPLTVRVVLDGTKLALPHEVDFSDGGDNGNQVRSFDFIFQSVAPGTHNVKLQFKASPDSFTDLNRHNVIVYFAP